MLNINNIALTNIIIALGALVFSTLSFADLGGYIQCEGRNGFITGAAVDSKGAPIADRKTWSNVLALDLKATVPLDVSTGRVVGAAKLKAMTITKLVDASGILLFQAMAENQTINVCTIDVVKNVSGNEEVVIVIELMNVNVVDYNLNNDSRNLQRKSDLGIESLKLSYEVITMTNMKEGIVATAVNK